MAYLQWVVPDCGVAFAPIWDGLITGQQFLSLKLKNSYSHSLPEWVVREYEILLKQLTMPLKRQEQGQVQL